MDYTTTTGLGLTGTSTANSSYIRVGNSDTYHISPPIPNCSFSTSSNYMENNTSQPQQVKVAVFQLEYNDDLKVSSTKFISEFWIEQKPKADLKLAVAKQLANKDVDLDKIVIREILRVSF